MYKVKISKNVVKYICKLGSSQHKYFLSRFEKLKYNKKGYKLLTVANATELWELRCQNHRIYYTVENEFIVINNIEYEGNIEAVRAGNKNTQSNDIKYMKKRIKR